MGRPRGRDAGRALILFLAAQKKPALQKKSSRLSSKKGSSEADSGHRSSATPSIVAHKARLAVRRAELDRRLERNTALAESRRATRTRT